MHVVAGLAVVFLMLGGIVVWAALTEIAGAVLSSGVVVVESDVKRVQHPAGGVVSEINVRNGSQVKAGDVVIRLDETVSRANLQMIAKQLDELVMREARLEAERDGAKEIKLPESYKGREQEPDIAKRITGETSFFTSRRASLDGQKEQLGERILQLRPVTFDHKNALSDTHYAATNRMGFIAQEVQEVFPDLVLRIPGPDSLLTLATHDMIPAMVKAIQELSAKVDDLERRNAALQAQADAVKSLQGEMAALKALLESKKGATSTESKER